MPFGILRAFARELAGLIGFTTFGFVAFDSFTGFESYKKPVRRFPDVRQTS
jgi:hypothetical protein